MGKSVKKQKYTDRETRQTERKNVQMLIVCYCFTVRYSHSSQESHNHNT